jgi:hypothetical protein
MTESFALGNMGIGDIGAGFYKWYSTDEGNKRHGFKKDEKRGKK